MSEPPPKKKSRHSKTSLHDLEKDELIERVQSQEEYIEQLESKLNNNGGEDSSDKEKNQISESSRRENVLVMRLANKEQEVQDYAAQIAHMRKAQLDGAIVNLRQALLDPGVNLLFAKMQEELQQTKKKLEQAESELSAWKFTPDSQNGKKLMARCRTLIAENKDLGEQLSQGKSAQLDAELALQKKYDEELKTNQDELNGFVIQLDEEVEGMQSTIQALQQQLHDAKRQLKSYEELVSEQDAKLGEYERALMDAEDEYNARRRHDQDDDARSVSSSQSEASDGRRDRYDDDERSVSESAATDDVSAAEDRRGRNAARDEYSPYRKHMYVEPGYDDESRQSYDERSYNHQDYDEQQSYRDEPPYDMQPYDQQSRKSAAARTQYDSMLQDEAGSQGPGTPTNDEPSTSGIGVAAVIARTSSSASPEARMECDDDYRTCRDGDVDDRSDYDPRPDEQDYDYDVVTEHTVMVEQNESDEDGERRATSSDSNDGPRSPPDAAKDDVAMSFDDDEDATNGDDAKHVVQVRRLSLKEELRAADATNNGKSSLNHAVAHNGVDGDVERNPRKSDAAAVADA